MKNWEAMIEFESANLRGMAQMGNMLDYLDWRGDLTFEQAPFNEVDNVILSHLSYVNFEGIVPPYGSDADITVAEAAERYARQYPDDVIGQFGYMVRTAAHLLRKLSGTGRFAGARLSHFQNVIDPDETKQFAAMQVRLSDGTAFIVYRGTDETIIGWKENFMMSFRETIPAQLEAVRYLEEVAGRHALPLRLGGHSKGGNLAVYAAIMCDPCIRTRILGIYNNDGPGFAPGFIAQAAYRNMRDNILTIVPQLSIVGMLLEHEEPQVVVKSNKSMLWQHDPFSWEVMGPRFVRVEQVGRESRLIEAAMKAWLKQLSPEEREQFVDNLFWVLEEAAITTIDDLARAKWKSVIPLIRALNQSEEHKLVLARSFKLLFRESRKVIRSARKKEHG